MTELSVTYLDHSGFIVDTGDDLMVFDYYRDPAAVLPRSLALDRRLWFFVSHAHQDHCNAEITRWQARASGFFLSSDIPAGGAFAAIPAPKRHVLRPYGRMESGPLTVSSLGSTDEGISFLAELGQTRIFHAGDLNWWHWKGDTPENLAIAEESFKNEIRHLAGVKLDVALFPVDSRLEEFRELGAAELCRQADVRQLIAMHTCGEWWSPGPDFPGAGVRPPVWCPRSPGDVLRLRLCGLHQQSS